MRRRLVAFGVAAMPLIIAIVVRAAFGACFPLCAIYNENNPEWYLFLCYLCG